MIKSVVHHGNARAVILDRALLRVVGIDPEGSVSIVVENGALVLRPPKRDPNEIKSPTLVQELLDNLDKNCKHRLRVKTSSKKQRQKEKL